MTLQEKLNQLQLDADWQINDDGARAGIGGVFSLTDPARIDHLQHVAVEQSRLHIPILFAFDTIHGYPHGVPDPARQASSFDPSVPTADDTIGAARRRPSASSRSTARWSTSRTSRAGADRRGRRRGSVPRLGARRRAREGRAGHDYSRPTRS
jgi:beta-glucosidase